MTESARSDMVCDSVWHAELGALIPAFMLCHDLSVLGLLFLVRPHDSMTHIAKDHSAVQRNGQVVSHSPGMGSIRARCATWYQHVISMAWHDMVHAQSQPSPLPRELLAARQVEADQAQQAFEGLQGPVSEAVTVAQPQHLQPLQPGQAPQRRLA